MGRLYLFVAIDRTSKFAFSELHEKATRSVAADFLRNLIKAVPYKVHTVLTDNGTHFTDPSGESWTVADIKAMIERKEPFWAHAFDVACARNYIDHRLHPRRVAQLPRRLRQRLQLRQAPTNTSAGPGQKSPNDSPSIRSSKCRD